MLRSLVVLIFPNCFLPFTISPRPMTIFPSPSTGLQSRPKQHRGMIASPSRRESFNLSYLPSLFCVCFSPYEILSPLHISPLPVQIRL